MDRPLKRIPAHVDNHFSVVSILVLVDRPLKPKVSGLVIPAARPFQSLFWWIGLSNPRRAANHKLYALCFNPCSGGSASQTARPLSFREGAFSVSILVLVDRPLKPSLWLPKTRRQFVSILVLVDRPLKPFAAAIPAPTAVGFNPCSGGSASQTETESLPATTRGVSILVLVDRPLKPRVFGTSHRRGEFQSLFWWIGLSNGWTLGATSENFRFQSLFWWIGLSNGVFGTNIVTTSDVSILVLVDRPLKPRVFGTSHRRGEFQSLFWWIGLSNKWQERIGREWRTGFNPCSGGSASQTNSRTRGQ